MQSAPYWGFHLAAAGHVVTLGLRNKPAGNLPDTWPKREGSPILRLIGSNPDSDQAVPVRLTGPAEPPPADLILLTTKAADAKPRPRRRRRPLPKGARLSSSPTVWNGGGCVRVFSARDGDPRSRLWRRASRVARKRPLHGEREKSYWPYGNRRKRATLRKADPLDIAVAAFWETRDIDGGCHRPETFRLGKKSMANLAINPLGALARVRNGIVGNRSKSSFRRAGNTAGSL